MGVKVSYYETQRLIDEVLKSSEYEAQQVLQFQLRLMGRSMPEFYDALIEHGPHISSYTSDHWFDFHRKVPHWRLLREKQLMDKLSPVQREKLGL